MSTCENHPGHTNSTTCKICKSEYCHDCHPSYLGICDKCGYKILIGLVVVMVVVSYIAWFGVL
jgi:PHP family Zn ribbon phosphoesterase